jgi:hypothetical protein
MAGDRLEFETKTMKVVIDYGKCEPAKKNTAAPLCGFACVKADRMYDRGVLRIEGNRPVLAGSPEDVKKNSNESLSWEYACQATGNDAIRILIPFPGLKEYRKKMNLIGGETIVDHH